MRTDQRLVAAQHTVQMLNFSAWLPHRPTTCLLLGTSIGQTVPLKNYAHACARFNVHLGRHGCRTFPSLFKREFVLLVLNKLRLCRLRIYIYARVVMTVVVIITLRWWRVLRKMDWTLIIIIRAVLRVLLLLIHNLVSKAASRRNCFWGSFWSRWKWWWKMISRRRLYRMRSFKDGNFFVKR